MTRQHTTAESGGHGHGRAYRLLTTDEWDHHSLQAMEHTDEWRRGRRRVQSVQCARADKRIELSSTAETRCCPSVCFPCTHPVTSRPAAVACRPGAASHQLSTPLQLHRHAGAVRDDVSTSPCRRSCIVLVVSCCGSWAPPVSNSGLRIRSSVVACSYCGLHSAAEPIELRQPSTIPSFGRDRCTSSQPLDAHRATLVFTEAKTFASILWRSSATMTSR
jgi:hypothetical protein